MSTTVIRTLATRVTADAQEFSKEIRRAEKDAERFAQSIRRQTRELELGADESKLYELSLRGVSGETTKAIREMIAHKNAAEEDANAIREIQATTEEYGRSLRNVSAGPGGKGFGKELKDIAVLLKGGGALGGAKILAKEFRGLAEGGRDFVAALVHGKPAFDQFGKLFDSLPILGDVAFGIKAVAESVGELAWGIGNLYDESKLLRGSGPVHTQASFDIQADLNRQIQDAQKLSDRAFKTDTDRRVLDIGDHFFVLKQNIGEAMNQLSRDDPVLYAANVEIAKKALEQLNDEMNRQQGEVKAAAAAAERERQAQANREFGLKQAEKYLLKTKEQIEAERELAKNRRDEEQAVIRGLQRSVELQEEANEAARDFKLRPTPALSSAGFGSSQAIQSILNSRRTDPTQNAILSEQRKAVRKLEKIEQNTKKQIVVRDLN